MHVSLMQKALTLAEQGAYSVHPNPMVGCVIAKAEHIIATGFHEHAGSPHAEIHALAAAGANARGADVYINLEPCCHFGRTPPCTTALIQAGVKRVFVAMLDPNPLVAGQGISELQAHGIEVKVGLLQTEAVHLNRVFSHYITRKTPYVIGKWAMSLDGKMAVAKGDDPVLSAPESLIDLHELRHRFPAILIGAGTALKDNPALTVRHTHANTICHPQRIVVNTEANLPTHLKLFDGSLPGKTWLVCSEAVASMAQAQFSQETTLILPCPTLDDKVDLQALLKLLGQHEIAGILVEGGPQILQSFFQKNLVNEVVAYLTPWIIANLPHKQSVQSLSLQALGQDFKIQGILNNP